MNQADAVLEKLQGIQRLWNEIQRTKPNTPEYETLMKQIRILSAEYQALVDAIKKPGQ